MDENNIWKNGSFNGLSFDETVKKYIQYQPKENATEKKIEDFKANDDGKNFSWVLDSDRGYLNINDSNRSIDWGIPNQVIGNPDTANVFLCLLNPRTRNDTSECSNLKKYIDLENKNNGEFFNSIDEYKTHIINDKENILNQEALRLSGRKLKPSEYFDVLIPKIKDYIDEHIRLGTYTITETSWETLGKKFVLTDDFKIIINREFNEMVNNNDKNVLIAKTDNKNELISDKLKCAISDEIKKWINTYNRLRSKKTSKKVSEKLLNKRLEEKLKSKIEAELDPLNDAYYFKEYYSSLLMKNTSLNKRDYLDSIYSNGNKFELLKICDLELLPYRTIDEHGIKFNDNAKYRDLISSRYVASLIIKRIKKYEIQYDRYESKLKKSDLEKCKDKEPIKPIFIFRSYSHWEETIKYCLKHEGNDMKLNEVYETLEENYFYRFPNAKGTITPGNIKKVRLPQDEFTEIRKKL
ncbi:hypothetical protein [Companilactobacillus kimchiensis]|uniref:Uncharacterized protein n=1 Tax=Companilactobacillus kimchiensis TaxID=993692 RepID=A0A0R2LFD0_9LACO|nr:hypothetical protein [Companilactobacillus kimchiensis]KRN98742.1 hypothetical protein IV57_GL000855 [Companilactobacillus kimchiensis]